MSINNKPKYLFRLIIVIMEFKFSILGKDGIKCRMPRINDKMTS